MNADIDKIEKQLKSIDNSIDIELCSNKNNCQQKNGIIIESILNNEINSDDCISIDENNCNEDLINVEEITCNCNNRNIENTNNIEGKIVLDLPLCFIHIKISKLKKYILSRISKGLRISTEKIEITKIESEKKNTKILWRININNKEKINIIRLFPNPDYNNNNFIKNIHGLLYLISKSFKDFPKRDLIGKSISFYIFKYGEYEQINNVYLKIDV